MVQSARVAVIELLTECALFLAECRKVLPVRLGVAHT